MFAKAAHQESIFGPIPFFAEKCDRFSEKTIDDSDRNLGTDIIPEASEANAELTTK